MIQQQTILRVSDSGAKTVRCFKVLGGFKKNMLH
jgi:ribosomal protein L14